MPTAYTLTQTVIADELPVLILQRADLAVDAPLIVVLHGLGSSKERLLPSIYDFAQLGCRVAAFDLWLHGERPGAKQRDMLLQTNSLATLSEIIERSIADLSRLLVHFSASPIGLHGISLGGYVTFGALLTEPRISAASVAMGSPDWLTALHESGLRPGNPTYDAIAARNPVNLLPSVYPPRPLLMQHGDLDDVVPIRGVQTLVERLAPHYRYATGNLALDVYPGHGHHYTDEMQRRSRDWFGEHLTAK